MTDIAPDLRRIVGADHVLPGDTSAYRHDATESRGLDGVADAVVRPGDAAQVAAVVAWCYEHDVAIVPRGGGTGFAGGCVPQGDGIVLDLTRLDGVRSFEPERWRGEFEAGHTTAHVRRRAREHGLLFAPDPGAGEQSQIGGNVATNAGGPHAFKYGVTGDWVTGIEAVLAPGELVRVGGFLTKDVAGYDLVSLLTGSEGTLGVITSVSLRFLPAPAAAYPGLFGFENAAAGCAAIDAVLANGLQPAALEFFDERTLKLAGWPADPTASGSNVDRVPLSGRTIDVRPFGVLWNADGSELGAAALADDLTALMREHGAIVEWQPREPAEIAALWRWRDGISIAVQARHGGKASEDIVVPVEHLAAAISATDEIGARHELETCSWGHAGDGNLHSTFLIDPHDADQIARAHAAGIELFTWAAAHGGSISGEHGLGLVKRGNLGLQWDDAAVAAHHAIKRALDPKGLFNPGKKR